MSIAPDQSDDLAARRASQGYQWTLESNWDGDNYIGPGLPPWGNRPRCPAIRNGRRCRKPCIPGGTICNTHGGAAPQVKRRAKLRVLQLLDPALGQLARTLANPADQRIGLAAIKLVVEMNGMMGRGDVDSTLAKAILMDRHHALQEAARKAAEEAVDGEIIEDADLVSETGVDGSSGGGSGQVGQVVLFEGDTRTQEEIDEDDELLYDPAAAADFAAAELAEFRASAEAELASNAATSASDDTDPDDPGPDDEPIVTFLHSTAPHHTATEPKDPPSAT